ncbi:cutinase family protein [Nocardia huaxiensis]|uniref:Cutinase family protein n=1 Tax=Nocardia huaxiensis TaxID=2755382 RepID=A0A7D6VJU1_9NOCA|nr:cutinase family protein [Nocardia huaxiensis]QLY31170.1 cutinase family protein [Nocardia huaxiensis]UFS94700.1 cutinase family protein [Nocardia huaxiensis]
MTTRRRNGKRRTPLPVKLLLTLLIIGAIIIAILLIWSLAAGLLRPPKPTPPGKEEPTSQPADCPDVFLLSVPGTWESNSNDDPYNPSANPVSLMLNISNPIRERFPNERLEVYTVPYVAQFSNPIAVPPDGQASYNVSRTEGTGRATARLKEVYDHCPLTTYVFAGFSQGAVIAGDIAESVGAGKGPVPANKVLGVMLIADGRRDVGQPGQATEIGQSPGGVGAEVALKGFNMLGITMTGPRSGFGDLTDRTYTICAPGDLICDAPKNALAPVNVLGSIGTLVKAVGNPVHSLYNGFVVDDNGTTATQWTVGWATGLIENAPHPAHS